MIKVKLIKNFIKNLYLKKYLNLEGMIQNSEGLNIPDNSFLEKQFVQIVVGRPGSGKSYYIEDLVTREDLYYKKFDFNIFITPSQWSRVKPSTENTKASIDVAWLFNRLNEIM